MCINMCIQLNKILHSLFSPPSTKPTRGIQYLVKEKVLSDSPPDVATFLTKQNGLSKEKIGAFVEEISVEFHMAVLE